MRRSVQQALPPMELEPLRTPVRTGTNWLRTGRDFFTRARTKSLLTQQQAAGHMGISESLLGEQTSGRENAHLSFPRMLRLPREFWQEMVPLLIEFHQLEIGMTERDRRDVEFARTVLDALQRRLA